VESLLRRGGTVRVLDDLSTGRRENLAALAGPRCELIEGSVRDLRLFREAMEGCGRVFHLAASVGVALITARPAECLRNNLEGTQNLFDAVTAQRHPPRVMLFSSSEVYGKSSRVPLREDEELVLGPTSVPRWSYASAKIVGEFQALAAHRARGLPVTVVRCFNTCGPRQLSAYGMVLPRFLEQALRGQRLTVYGDGRQTRCFSNVADVVEQVLLLEGHPAAAGEVFNVGNDEEISILELARLIVEISGSRSEVVNVPYPSGYGPQFEDVPRRVPDLTKLRAYLGNTPETDLRTLIERTLRGHRADPARAAGAAAPPV